MSPALARTLNALGLIAISVVLLAAFAEQFINGELPCPLCLLQRAGFVAAGLGIALNVAIEPRPAHYAMAIVSAIVGAAVSLRQVALHVVPGTGAYGSAFLGFHFYTWAFIVFALIILGCAAMLFFERQFEPELAPRPVRLAGMSLIAVALFAVLALGNGVSTLAECELGLCPDNPTSYMLFDSAPGNGSDSAPAAQ